MDDRWSNEDELFFKRINRPPTTKDKKWIVAQRSKTQKKNSFNKNGESHESKENFSGGSVDNAYEGIMVSGNQKLVSKSELKVHKGPEFQVQTMKIRQLESSR